MRCPPWRKRKPSPEVVEAHRRLERVKADDIRVDALSRRTNKIVRENGLGPAIMKALGVDRSV